MMIRDIEKRSIQFKPYGVVFTKTTCSRTGCNPVWYLDMSLGSHDWLTRAVDRLVARVKEESRSGRAIDPTLLIDQDILQLTPFIEQMGNPAGVRKEFWWEREWRHKGDFKFRPRQVVAALAPESEHGRLESEIDDISQSWKRRRLAILDPNWGAERMIAALARVPEEDWGPFPDF